MKWIIVWIWVSAVIIWVEAIESPSIIKKVTPYQWVEELDTAALMKAFRPTKEKDILRIYTKKLVADGKPDLQLYTLPICRPSGNPFRHRFYGTEYIEKSQVLYSPFNFQRGKRISCGTLKQGNSILGPKFNKLICPRMDANMHFKLTRLLQENYATQWIVDGLPVEVHYRSRIDKCEAHRATAQTVQVDNRLKVGCMTQFHGQERYFVNNHFSFEIRYAKDDLGTMTIERVSIEPSSIGWTRDTLSLCHRSKPLPEFLPKFEYTTTTEFIPWTFSVRWIRTNPMIPSRFDIYHRMDQPSLHESIYSLLSSISIPFALTICLWYISRFKRDSPTLEVHTKELKPLSVSILVLSTWIAAGLQFLFCCIISIFMAYLYWKFISFRFQLLCIWICFLASSNILLGTLFRRLLSSFRVSYHSISPALSFTILFLPVMMLIFAYSLLEPYNALVDHPISFPLIFSIFSLWIFTSIPLFFFGFSRPFMPILPSYQSSQFSFASLFSSLIIISIVSYGVYVSHFHSFFTFNSLSSGFVFALNGWFLSLLYLLSHFFICRFIFNSLLGHNLALFFVAFAPSICFYVDAFHIYHAYSLTSLSPSLFHNRIIYCCCFLLTLISSSISFMATLL